MLVDCNETTPQLYHTKNKQTPARGRTGRPTFSRCLYDIEPFAPFSSAPVPFPAPPPALLFSAAVCLCRLTDASDDHRAESSVTIFGRDICGGIKPFDTPPGFSPSALLFLFLLALLPLLLLFILPPSFLRLGVAVAGESVGGLAGPEGDMKDPTSTESKRSAAEGSDICSCRTPRPNREPCKARYARDTISTSAREREGPGHHAVKDGYYLVTEL